MAGWKLRGFTEAFDLWLETYKPDHEVRMQVGNWILRLMDDPFPPEAVPVPGVDAPLWLADIPGTMHSCAFLVHDDPPTVIAYLLEEHD